MRGPKSRQPSESLHFPHDDQTKKGDKMSKISFNEVITKEEILSILKLYEESLPTLKNGTVDKTQYAEKIARFGNVLVMTADGKPAGFAAYYCNDTKTKTAYLAYIAVAPDFLHFGLGSRLLNEVKKRSLKSGMEFLRLEVRADNDRAIRFYLRERFVREGENGDRSFYMICNLV